MNFKTILLHKSKLFSRVFSKDEIAIKSIDLNNPSILRQVFEIERVIPKNVLKSNLKFFKSSPLKALLGLFYREHLLLQNFIHITETIPEDFSLLDMLIKHDPLKNKNGQRFINLFSISRRETPLLLKIGDLKITEFYLQNLPAILETHFPEVLNHHYQIRTFSPIYPLMSWVRNCIDQIILKPRINNPIKDLIQRFEIKKIPDLAYGNAPSFALGSNLHRIQTLLAPQNPFTVPWQYQIPLVRNILKNFLIECASRYLAGLINLPQEHEKSRPEFEICPAFQFHVLQNKAAASELIYSNYQHPEMDIPFGTSYIYETKFFNG